MNPLHLNLREASGDTPIEIAIRNVVVAGWTGRNQEALQAHIRELSELGVKPPRTTPVFYRVAASLLMTCGGIQVIGTGSTGEVEFVLIQHDKRLLVTVGSDHTDRKAEAIGVTLSKQMCTKPIASDVWDFDAVEPHWDELVLRSYAVVDGIATRYQEGKVSAMCHPRDLIERYCGGALQPGTAMFGGTFAVEGGIRWAGEFRMELEDPVLNRVIKHSYEIESLPIEG